MEFLLVGEEMSAERAYQIGFVNKVAPKGQHVALARRWRPKSPPMRRWWSGR
jgi:enoyl-CoA hydratase